MRLAGVMPGMSVADIGAGEGYYTMRLSPIVGPRGRVLAEDIVPRTRDQLAQRLAQLTGGTTSLRSDGGIDVTVGGVALVTGVDAGTLVITGGVTPTGADDGNPLTFSEWSFITISIAMGSPTKST